MKKVLFILICVWVLQLCSAFAGLLEGKRKKVEELAQRIREQQANLWSLPDSVKLIKAEDELKEFCSASDLVDILESDEYQLRNGAFQLLTSSYNKALEAKEIDKLLNYLQIQDPSEDWRGLWAGRVLVKNETLGIPALLDVLKNTKNHFARVQAASALAGRDVKLNASVRREAQQTLLEALGNSDDSARLAHNAAQPLEPWMVEWLIKALPAAKDNSSLWQNGTSLLSGCDSRGYEDALRSVFLQAVKYPLVNARMNAVNGLRNLGLKEDDFPLYQLTQKDENPHVRRMLYAGLTDKGASWAAPLLLDGLDDTLAENVEICARGLMQLQYFSAVPKLVETLKKAPVDSQKPFTQPYRSVGEAIAKLAKQNFDFVLRTSCKGNAHIHADLIENRDAAYRQEASRLLRWWEESGSKEKW